MGLVPPVGIEPVFPTVLDESLLAGPQQLVVAGAAHPELHLEIDAQELQRLTGAATADVLEAEEATVAAAGTKSPAAPAGTRDVAAPAEPAGPVAFPLHAAEGPALHLVAVAAAVRRIGRGLAFLDIVPPGTPLEADRAAWAHPNGSGSRVRIQLIVGRSLGRRLGDEGAAAVVRRLRSRQLLYVAGRVKLMEPGEQTGPVQDSPEAVRQKREAQLDAGVVDVVAEQLRVLEEVHVVADAGSSAGPAGVAAPSTAVGVAGTEPAASAGPAEEFLDFTLPARAVHVVDSAEALSRFEGVLRERLMGRADIPTESGMEATPVLPVVGLDAEWRPDSISQERSPVALLQLAFRRSVFLLDLSTLLAEEGLGAAVADAVRRLLEAPQLFKVGFGLTNDLKRLAECLPGSLPGGAASVLDLKRLAAAALPGKEPPGGLAGLCRVVLGRGLDKTEQTSDWASRPLRPAQIAYAAQDAHVCVRLFDAFCYRHATLATQPLRPLLHSMAVDWPQEAGSPSAGSAATAAESLGPMRIDAEGRAAAWREAAGQRMQGGFACCARWAAGVPGATHLALPWDAPREAAGSSSAGQRRVCRFANAAAIFLRAGEAPGPFLPGPEAAALLGLRGPLAVFVLLRGGWHCAGRGSLEPERATAEGASSLGAAKTPRLRLSLLDAAALASTPLAAWATAWQSPSEGAGV